MVACRSRVLQPFERCSTLPSSGVCPSAADAFAAWKQVEDPCATLVSVDGPATIKEKQCCYPTTVDEDPICYGSTGRPLLIGAHVIVAATRARRDWVANIHPNCEGLERAERDVLAAAWVRAAHDEHASIAAFAGLSLDLLAHGAPASLVAAAHEAALDEVRHARASYALASTYMGSEIGPDRLPIGDHLPIAKDLIELVEATVRGGCINETVAAILAANQRDRAQDPAVRAVLEAIAEEEANHAELAFRVVVWAIGQGGESVREAALRAFDSAPTPNADLYSSPSEPASPLAAHGLLNEQERRAIELRALREVVLPCVQQLRVIGFKPADGCAARRPHDSLLGH